MMDSINEIEVAVKRPGGFEITERALSFCNFKQGAKVLDIGCGSGATVDYLINNYALNASGIDKDLKQACADKFYQASAEDLPFDENSMDGIFMECSFSLVKNQERALAECCRMLRQQGYIIITDMYSRGEPAQLDGCLGNIDSKENIITLLEDNAFIVDVFEDFSHQLQGMWGQMIFDKGAKAFYCNLGVSHEKMKRIKCGYYLIVARKKERNNISAVHSWTAKQTGLHENLSATSLLNWQQEKLHKLINYASENTIFYRDKFGDSNKLIDLPFTFPADIASNPLAFLAIPQADVARVTTLANSGTTRLRKRVFFSEADLERTIEFFAVGMSSLVSNGEKAKILISNRTENSLGSLLKESLSRIGVNSEIAGVLKSVDKAIEFVASADCLIGMPAELFYMSCIAPYLRPNSVLLTADYIPQSIINGIKENWKCKVFSHYGHTEFGYGCAVDCEQHDGFHLRDADFIFEIINPETDKPVKEGESGEVVVTTLSNKAMPLIRYRTGNISSFVSDTCKCGSTLPRLTRLEGRYESFIPVGNGQTISIHQLDELLFANPLVKAFNAFWVNNKTLRLIIDSYKNIDKAFLEKKLPENIELEIVYDNADPFMSRRKRRIQIIPILY